MTYSDQYGDAARRLDFKKVRGVVEQWTAVVEVDRTGTEHVTGVLFP